MSNQGVQFFAQLNTITAEINIEYCSGAVIPPSGTVVRCAKYFGQVVTIRDVGMAFFSQSCQIGAGGISSLSPGSRDKSLLVLSSIRLDRDSVINKDNYIIKDQRGIEVKPLHVVSLLDDFEKVKGAMLQIPQLIQGEEYEVIYTLQTELQQDLTGTLRVVAV